MKMSKKKKDALYRAISETITDSRVSVAKYAKTHHGGMPVNLVDTELYHLENKIWAKVSLALGLIEI